MIKVQRLDPTLGWVHSTRAGDLPQAWGVLTGYRRGKPNEQHRLVDVSEAGVVTVIPDDEAVLAIYAEMD